MERIVEIAIDDMLTGINITGTALHSIDVTRIKTYLRIIFKLKDINEIDINELQQHLEKRYVVCQDRIIKLVKDKNNGHFHKGIDKKVKFQSLKRKWSDQLDKEQFISI